MQELSKKMIVVSEAMFDIALEMSRKANRDERIIRKSNDLMKQSNGLLKFAHKVVEIEKEANAWLNVSN
jgi:hypothetical protein